MQSSPVVGTLCVAVPKPKCPEKRLFAPSLGTTRIRKYSFLQCKRTIDPGGSYSAFPVRLPGTDSGTTLSKSAVC